MTTTTKLKASARAHVYYAGKKPVRVWVVKGNESPDPAKALLWGYSDNGEQISGNFKRMFERTEDTLSVSVTRPRMATAQQEKLAVLNALRDAIIRYAELNPFVSPDDEADA